MTTTPFTQAKVGPLKLLMYGPAAAGKTRAALTFPRPAVIDTEGGADKYAGLVRFDLLRVSSFKATLDAIRAVREDGGRTWDTLVLDCITPIWTRVKAHYVSDSGVGNWAKANAAMRELYGALHELPVHVVVTAHQYTELEVAGKSVTKLGLEPEADKSIRYAFDYVIRMLDDHSGIVERSRGPELFPGGKLRTVNWDAFRPLYAPPAGPGPVPFASEEERDERERRQFQDPTFVKAWVTGWLSDASWTDSPVNAMDLGLTEAKLKEILGVRQFQEWALGEKAADERVGDWVEAATPA